MEQLHVGFYTNGMIHAAEELVSMGSERSLLFKPVWKPSAVIPAVSLWAEAVVFHSMHADFMSDDNPLVDGINGNYFLSW